jgi:hypothetical protein
MESAAVVPNAAICGAGSACELVVVACALRRVARVIAINERPAIAQLVALKAFPAVLWGDVGERAAVLVGRVLRGIAG